MAIAWLPEHAAQCSLWNAKKCHLGQVTCYLRLADGSRLCRKVARGSEISRCSAPVVCCIRIALPAQQHFGHILSCSTARRNERKRERDRGVGSGRVGWGKSDFRVGNSSLPPQATRQLKAIGRKTFCRPLTHLTAHIRGVFPSQSLADTFAPAPARSLAHVPLLPDQCVNMLAGAKSSSAHHAVMTAPQSFACSHEGKEEGQSPHLFSAAAQCSAVKPVPSSW